MTNPKQLFEELAQSTWTRLGLSWNYNISQGEETITDLLQLEIARFGPPDIYVQKMTKAHEARSGVDWEWWVGNGRSGWLRLAVQAKKIYQTGRYDALKHKVKKASGGVLLQHNALQRYADATSAVPLYCLFNHVPPAEIDKNRHWHCADTFDYKQLGYTLTPVERIRQAINNHGCRTFDFIHHNRYTVPWRCLFCSHCNGLSTLLDAAAIYSGVRPFRYRQLPGLLRYARETDEPFSLDRAELNQTGLLQDFWGDSQRYYGADLQIFPRRILMIEIDLADVMSGSNLEDLPWRDAM